MKKLQTLFLILTIAIVAVPSASAYEIISRQRQEVTSESELKIENNGSSIVTNEVYQEQRQWSDSSDDSQKNSDRKPLQRVQKAVPYQQKDKRLEKAADTAADRKDESNGLVKNCEAVATRLTSHAEGFQTSYQQRENNYKRIYQVITELINRLDNTTTDLTDLRSAATNLQKERAELLAAADAYVTKAEEIKNLSCDGSATERRTKFEQLRTLRQAYEKEHKDVRIVIENELKPALQAVKNSTTETN